MKYRKKPIVIEAVEWTGENMYELFEFADGEDMFGVGDTKVSVFTLEGTMTAEIGDYIIKGVKGEFYPCKPDIFHLTYEAVEE